MKDQLTRLESALADRYRIERELGAGGMATVYLAQDLKHDRRVAIKVLKPELAAVLGAERFVQEIKTTAGLQHPHILPLHDSGEAGGFLYYVMPYIEGETLRTKLDREKQLGIEEAIKITTEVADALDYAHRNNVIHRDIKPENILLHDGRPMVADFGIALAVSAAAGGRMTETGLSLGTPHYMSPEQATAEKDLTNRSDIYSLGAVLYEMLTGSPPHVGSSAQQIIMKIVTEEAQPVAELRKTVPPHIGETVATALEKLPADRFDSATAFAASLHGATPIRRRTVPRRQAAAPVNRGAWVGWGVGAVGLALAVWALLGSPRPREPQSAVRHLNILLPDSAPLVFVGEGTLGVGRRALALSPDARTLVYAARVKGVDQLYRRDLAEFTATPIAGTEGAFYPFISPDGQWVAFFVGAELRKAPMGGGAAVRLAPVPETFGAAWSRDGRILVTAREGWVLGWVPESGGPIQEIPNPQAHSRTQPNILPDGRHALVEIVGATLQEQVIGVTDLESGRTVALTVEGPVVADSVERSSVIWGRDPRYLPSGHLVYSTSAGLVAVAFDPVEHTVRGRAVEVLSDVRRDLGAHYALGSDGTLVYAAGGDGNVGALAWVTRDGAVDSLGFAAQRYGTFEFSPDAQRIAALVFPASGEVELWVYDIARGTESKVLTRGTPSLPRWWPDGRRIVFTETSNGFPYARASIRQLVESAGERDTLGLDWEITDFSPDTSRAAGTLGFGGGSWIFPLEPGLDAISLDSFSTAWGPTFSRDGHWIAYTSNESGQYEIYVTAADRLGLRQKISLAGGEEPLWSQRGDELIYRWGQEWFAAAVPEAGSSTFGRPRVIFRGPYVNVPWRSHDIAPDGSRHLLLLGPLEQSTDRLNVITNWLDELARRVER